MPVSFRIDKSLGLVFTTAEGVLTVQDILTHLHRLRDEPDFGPSYDQLIDLRDVIEFSVSGAEMRTISRHHLFNEGSRRAIVAESKITFGMARMYQMLRETYGKPDVVRVFRDMAEARCWLGLD